MINRTKDVANFDKDNIPVLKTILDKIQREAQTSSEVTTNVNNILLGGATTLVIENRTADPSTPSTGQVWIRTDL